MNNGCAGDVVGGKMCESGSLQFEFDRPDFSKKGRRYGKG